MTNFEWIKSLKPYALAQTVSKFSGAYAYWTAEELFDYFNEEAKLSWDDIFWRANDCGYGSDELKAKDEARYQLTCLINDECGYDIEECECPEDEIDLFLGNRDTPVFFDEYGNIVSK